MLWKADYPYYRYVLIFLYFFFVSCPHMRRLWAGAGVMRRKYLAGNCRSVVPPWILWRRSRERLHSTSRSPTVLDIGDPERRRFKRFGWSEKRADIQTGRRQYNGGKNDTDGRGSGCKRRPPGHAAWSRAIFRQPWYVRNRHDPARSPCACTFYPLQEEIHPLNFLTETLYINNNADRTLKN